MSAQIRRAARRAARVAFTFVMMNYSALSGLFSLRRGRHVWK